MSLPRADACRIGPMPGQVDAPKQHDSFFDAGCAAADEPGSVDDTAEHGEKEYHKGVAESLAFQPSRHFMAPRKSDLTAEHAEQLTAVAIAIAEELVAADDGK